MPEFLPYGRQAIDAADIAAVEEVLRSDWLTTGPQVEAFEDAVAAYTQAEHAVAVANGTAALHAAVHAAGLGPGDEVIVPPMTFAATANAVLYEDAVPVFADVDPDTLLLDPDAVERKLTDDTAAILTVDYAGQPSDYKGLSEIAEDHDLTVIADGCHALGATDRGRPVGSMADLTVFSFHPVKHITTAEGGMVTTDDPDLADALARFRDHGRTTDHPGKPDWYYKIVELGRNLRLSDVACALGTSQLDKLPGWLKARRDLAGTYRRRLRPIGGIEPLAVRSDVDHAYHLFVIRIDGETTGVHRDEIHDELQERSIGTNVHYIPVHLHPYYRETLDTGLGDCPVAEAAYDEILSIPLFPQMSPDDLDRVVDALDEIVHV